MPVGENIMSSPQLLASSPSKSYVRKLSTPSLTLRHISIQSTLLKYIGLTPDKGLILCLHYYFHMPFFLSPHSPQIPEIAKGPGQSTSSSSKAGSLSQMLSPSRTGTRSRGLSMNILDSSLGSRTSPGPSPTKTSLNVEGKTDSAEQSQAQVHPQAMSPPTQGYQSAQTSALQTPRTPERDLSQNPVVMPNNPDPIAFGSFESSSSSSHSDFDSADSDYDDGSRSKRKTNDKNQSHRAYPHKSPRAEASEGDDTFSRSLHTRNFLQQKKMFYSGQSMSSLSGFIPGSHTTGNGVEASTSSLRRDLSSGSAGSISTTSTLTSSTVLPPLRTDRRSEELRAALLLSTSSLIKAHQPSHSSTSYSSNASTTMNTNANTSVNSNSDTNTNNKTNTYADLSSSSSSHTSSPFLFSPHDTTIVSVPSSLSTPSSSLPPHSALSPMTQKNRAFASATASLSPPFSTPYSTPFSSPLATSPVPAPVGLLASPRPTLFPEEYWSTSARRVVSQLRILSASLGSALGGDRGGSVSIRTLLQRESTIARTEANLVPLGTLFPSLLKEATAVERLLALSPLGSFGIPSALEPSPVLKFDEVLTLFCDAQKDQAKEREAYEQKEREKEERRTSRTHSYDGSSHGHGGPNSGSDTSFSQRLAAQPPITLSVKTIKTTGSGSGSGSSTGHVSTTQSGLGTRTKGRTGAETGLLKETTKGFSTSMPDHLPREREHEPSKARDESDGEEDIPITQSGPLVF